MIKRPSQGVAAVFCTLIVTFKERTVKPGALPEDHSVPKQIWQGH